MTPKALEIIDQTLGKIPYLPGGLLQPLKTPSKIREFGVSPWTPIPHLRLSTSPSAAGKKTPYQLTEHSAGLLHPWRSRHGAEGTRQMVVGQHRNGGQSCRCEGPGGQEEDKGNALETFTVSVRRLKGQKGLERQKVRKNPQDLESVKVEKVKTSKGPEP